MEEYNEDEKLDKYTKERVENGIKELEEEKELKIKWRKEIDENAALQLYLSQYSSYSVKNFIKQYIIEKYNAYRYGDMYIQIAETERSRWIDMAHEHLKCILQKQLFDLQCQWRADEIKLEGVEKCYDFRIWSDDILNCPFLKPITKEDIKLYQEFLMKVNIHFSRYSIWEDWQNYHEIKESYQSDGEDSSIPDWYEHHYTHTGTTNLLLLPDIRGEKEEFYRRLYFKNQHKVSEEKKIKDKENNEPITLVDNRPYLSDLEKETTNYIFENYEDPDLQIKHKYYCEGIEGGIDNSHYEDLYRELLDFKEPIPIKSNYSIKDAVQEAYNNHLARKVAEHLPTAHEQYLFNREMGFVVQVDNRSMEHADDIYTNTILGGRELNGEPRDFNF